MITRESFLSRVEITADGCWLWKRAINDNGYGVLSVDGKYRYAHRVSHELFIGPIPEGYEVDHVKARGCVSRACVRPGHLEAVTPKENNMRSDSCMAKYARRTHCPKGHPLDGVTTRRNGVKQRYCLQCNRSRAAARAAEARQ